MLGRGDGETGEERRFGDARSWTGLRAAPQEPAQPAVPAVVAHRPPGWDWYTADGDRAVAILKSANEWHEPEKSGWL